MAWRFVGLGMVNQPQICGFAFALDQLLRNWDLNALAGGMATWSSREPNQESEKDRSVQRSRLFSWKGVFALGHR